MVDFTQAGACSECCPIISHPPFVFRNVKAKSDLNEVFELASQEYEPGKDPWTDEEEETESEEENEQEETTSTAGRTT
jgi:hypothetical protein